MSTLKRYNGTSWETIGGNIAPKTTKTTSTTDTYSCDYVNNLNTYSTSEEIVVGTWIDGKPIYRKVIYLANGTGQTTEKTYTLSDYGITNVSDIWVASPSYYTANNNRWPFSYYDGNTYMASVNPTQLKITITHQLFADSPTLITLEYTKTTD